MKKLRILLSVSFLLFITTFAYAQIPPCGYNPLFTTTQNGPTTVFVASGTNIPASVDYYWSYGDGTNGFGGPTNLHNYTANGVYTACLYIYDSLNFCMDTICSSVTVTGLSTCNASFSNSYVNNTLIQFTNASTAPGAFTSTWYFGDGTSSMQANPTHTYANSGIYNVCLVISGGGCVDSFCSTITAFGSSPCNANFTTSINNNSALFINSSTGIGLSYLWWFGDGFTSNLANPTHSYNAPGVYTVCLFITDSLNQCADSICQTITITSGGSNACNAQFGVNVQGCNAVLTNASTGPYTAGLWVLGNGTTQILTTATNVVTANYPSNGVYTACLIVSDSFGTCIDTVCNPIVIFGCATAIGTIEANHIFNVYPNPASNVATISITSKSSENLEIEVYDLLGKKLYTQKYNARVGQQNIVLDMQNYSAGAYIIKISDEHNNHKLLRLSKQ